MEEREIHIFFRLFTKHMVCELCALVAAKTSLAPLSVNLSFGIIQDSTETRDHKLWS